MIIAIDGPSGAGKGTLARELARCLELAYLDTGLLFRALALKARTLRVPPEDVAQLADMAAALEPKDWQQEGLRTTDIANTASILALYPQVRTALKKMIRAFANLHEKEGKGVVLDGRDIGTVVCPDACVKFFITAIPQERARRRFLELQSNGFTGTLSEVLSDIERRDKRDQSRALAPLKPAEDAIIIDTTSLDRADVLNIALNYILKSNPGINIALMSGI